MRTSARRDGDRYVLNGRKMWITNGALDDHTLGDAFLIYAKTGQQAISTFIVERGMPGFSLRPEDQGQDSGMRASTMAELVFDDVRGAGRQPLGDEGQSVRHMMRNLEIERVTLAAMCWASRCAACARWSAGPTEREAFGRPIRDFGQIQRHIADSYAQWRAMPGPTSTTWPAGCASTGPATAPTLTASSSSPSTMAKEVADRAMQVLGGVRLRGRGRGRAALARRQAAGDRRRDARGAPEEHHARPVPRR